MPLPTRDQIWDERLNRLLRSPAGMPRQLHDPTCREIFEDLLDAIAAHDLKLMLRDGRWVENPEFGDDDALAAKVKALWDDLGEHLGIGPRPGPPIAP